MTSLPKIVVVGDPRLGDLLAKSGAQWEVQPVMPTVTAMWDASEAGQIDLANASAAIFTDGTGTTPDELELSLATFASYCPTFVFADQSRWGAITNKVREVAPSVGTDPNVTITMLPVTDLNQALATIQQVLGPKVQWGAPVVASAPTSPAQPAAPVVPPAPQPVAQTPATQTFAPQANIAAPTTGARSYDQANAYADHIIQQAQQHIPKPPDALPGQITISCMSSKGGSGKSTTALCLAGTIAKASAAAGNPKKVVLVDLDTRDGQVGSLIGQFMPTAISIRVLPKWDANSVRMNLVHDKNLGIDALLAPVRPRNADDVGPDFYKTIIGILQTTHDVVILDCSVNYLDPLLGTAFAMSDEILFVTTLATTSVQGMARSLTELFADPSDGGLGIPREKVGIVANQVINNVGMGKDKLLKAALGAPLVGQIPSDQDAVLVATNSNKMGNLLKHPKLGPAYYKLAVTCLPSWELAPLTNEQAQVAENMNKANGVEAPAPQKKGLFRR